MRLEIMDNYYLTWYFLRNRLSGECELTTPLNIFRFVSIRIIARFNRYGRPADRLLHLMRP